MSSSSNCTSLQVQCSPIRNNQLKVYWFLLQWIVEVFKELQKVPCRFFFWFRSRVWTMSLRKAPKLVGKSTLTTLLPHVTLCCPMLTTLLPDVTSKWSPANPRMLYTLLPIAAAKYILPFWQYSNRVKTRNDVGCAIDLPQPNSLTFPDRIVFSFPFKLFTHKNWKPPK